MVGDIEMDCEKFGIGMDAGISFSAEKNFKTRETTLAIGIGISGDLSLPVPFVDWEGSVGASEQLFVVFNGDNQPSDIGIKMEAGGKVDISATAGPASTGIGSSGIGGGFSLGLNSGWSFQSSNTGIFKGLSD